MPMQNYFNNEYQIMWNKSRINKLISILGKEWFKDKRILEVGSGHGEVGIQLIKELGAKVTFTDGRDYLVEDIKKEGYEAYVMDNNHPWTVGGTYDLIIHWGLSYHLSNWKADLLEAFKHSNLICFETEIADFEDDTYEKVIDERDHYDQAINHKGVLISSSHLERIIRENGFSFVRYDDTDLNANIHQYDWIDGERIKDYPDTGFRSGQRRFYMIRKVTENGKL